MRKTANAKLRMLNSVTKFLEAQIESFEAIPRLQQKTNELKVLYQKTRILGKLKDLDVVGVTNEKNKLRQSVNAQAMLLSGFLYSYAKEHKQFLLSLQVKFCKSDFSRASAIDNLAMLDSLVTKVDEIGVEKLYPYGWSEERNQTFQLMVDDFAVKMSSPFLALKSRSSYSHRFYDKLEEAMEMLSEDIDVMMQLLQESQHEMVYRYQLLRKVIYPGRSRRKSV